MDYDQLIYNAIRTPDGTLLESLNRHDFRVHTDNNGEQYMVDGGLDYIKRSYHKDNPPEDLSLTLNDPHDKLREVYTWGSYGINGDQPLVTKPLKDLDSDHIDAIIRTQSLPEQVIQLFKNELAHRDGT